VRIKVLSADLVSIPDCGRSRQAAQGAALGPALPAEEFLELLRGSHADTAMLRTLDLGDERLLQD
jgi:hypothetical protein